MKLFASILLLLSSATLPNFAADGDAPALQRRVIRTAANPEITARYTGLPATERVIKQRRIIAPVAPVTEPIVEPPIPKSYSEDFIVETPVAPVEELVEPLEIETKSVRQTDAEKALGIAKSYYRRSLWESAAEWYLMALEWNPKSLAAAEGFVMSAFHAGQYNYAYRVGNEISESIPGVKDKVVRAANEEIELLLKNRQFEQAGEMLNHFPLEEPAFKAARTRLETLKSQPSHKQVEVSTEELLKTQTDIESARGTAVKPLETGYRVRLELLVNRGEIPAGESKAADTAAFGLNVINILPMSMM